MHIKQNLKNWIKQIGALSLVLALAISTLSISVNAATGTLPLSETIDLRTDLGRVAYIDCSIAYTFLKTPSTSDNPRPSSGRHYAEGTNQCLLVYTDSTNNFYIKAGKSHTHNLSSSSDATEIIDNIDNSGGTATDYAIDSSGNDNTNEEFGYRVKTLTVSAGAASSITVQDDGNFDFNGTTCGSGTDDCYFDISDTLDTVVTGDNTSNAALCMTNSECYLTYKFAANITNETAPGAYGVDDPSTTGVDETYEFKTEITITP